jgi:gluconate kinase
MTNTLLVVFGKPGAGKSFVANILSDSFEYHCHDGDTDLPKAMREALFRKEIITDAMRKEFITNMIASIQKLSKKHKKIVVHQTFLKEYMRKQFLSAFPDAKFLLIESRDDIRENRYMKRNYFNLGLPYLRHMTHLFEKVTIPHVIIKNDTEGTRDLLEVILELLGSRRVTKLS